MENQTITLECEVSKPDIPAKWYIDGKEIQHGGRYEIRIEGTNHFLTIKEVQLDDEGDYTIKIADKQSTGGVFVEEEPVEFIRKLEDQDVTEIPGTATFECELSKEVPVQWFRHDKPITAGDKYDIIAEGRVHRLIVKNVNGDDEADFHVTARGKKSTAGLFIE
ncbi:unnamed protein product, partial [Owenia fusiformis]